MLSKGWESIQSGSERGEEGQKWSRNVQIHAQYGDPALSRICSHVNAHKASLKLHPHK